MCRDERWSNQPSTRPGLVFLSLRLVIRDGPEPSPGQGPGDLCSRYREGSGRTSCTGRPSGDDFGWNTGLPAPRWAWPMSTRSQRCYRQRPPANKGLDSSGSGSQEELRDSDEKWWRDASDVAERLRTRLVATGSLESHADALCVLDQSASSH